VHGRVRARAGLNINRCGVSNLAEFMHGFSTGSTEGTKQWFILCANRNNYMNYEVALQKAEPSPSADIPRICYN
jgi:hypothetical protein